MNIYFHLQKCYKTDQNELTKSEKSFWKDKIMYS